MQPVKYVTTIVYKFLGAQYSTIMGMGFTPLFET
jgi:hypothetical protein